MVLYKLPSVSLARLDQVVLSVAMELPVKEFAFVNIAVELKAALSCLLAVHKIAFEDDGVGVPGLLSLAVVDIVKPLSFIHGAVAVDEDAVAGSLAFLPFPLVDVSAGVGQSALAVEEAVLRLALVL